MYTLGSCPDTRANNYKVASLNIVNECTDAITVANNDTCNAVISKGAFPFVLCHQLSARSSAGGARDLRSRWLCCRLQLPPFARAGTMHHIASPAQENALRCHAMPL